MSVRLPAASVAAVFLLSAIGVGNPGAARAAVPTGVVTPKIAPVGAWIHVSVDGDCAGAAARDVTVRFVSSLDREPWASAVRKARAYRVVAKDDLGYRLRVPNLPAGPYGVAIACGGEPYGFSDEGAGPTFTVRPRVWPGATAFAYAFFPEGCEALVDDGGGWADPRAMIARAADIADAADERLSPATVVDVAEWLDGFFLTLRVPRVAPGRYWLYTACSGTFLRQDVAGAPVIEVLGPADTSTDRAAASPSRGQAPEAARLLVAVLAGLLGAGVTAVRVTRRRGSEEVP